jgi:hypothetical protein
MTTTNGKLSLKETETSDDDIALPALEEEPVLAKEVSAPTANETTQATVVSNETA